MEAAASGNMGGTEALPETTHGRPYSLRLTLPPLGALFLEKSLGKVDAKTDGSNRLQAACHRPNSCKTLHLDGGNRPH